MTSRSRTSTSTWIQKPSRPRPSRTARAAAAAAAAPSRRIWSAPITVITVVVVTSWYQDVTTTTVITVIGADQIRRDGAAAAAAAALAVLEGRGLDGFWIHVDVDVLDREVMPAVDSPEPDGLDYQELITLLRALTASGLAVGAEVAIFDPDLDPDGHLAQELVTAVVDGFGP